jgi:hypothetical protein
MILTQKCKQDFNEWYTSWMLVFLRKREITNFYEQPILMQYGEYIEFFNTSKYEGKPLFDYVFSIYYDLKIESQTHNDLVRLSIEKANEIYNKYIKLCTN